jgi:PAS domain S-box-containing protein
MDFSNQNEIVGHRTIYDYQGKRLGFLHFTMPREIAKQGDESMWRVLLVLAGVVVFNGIVYYLVLKGVVIGRLVTLSQEVQRVGESNVEGERIKELSGSDELASLSRKINQMLINLQSQSELAKTGRENLRSYIDVVGVMMVVIDPEGKVVLVNKKAAEVLGVTQEEIVGVKWFDKFVPEESREQVKQVFERLMKGEEEPTEYYENEVTTIKGERRLIAWHNAIMRDEAGKIVASLSAGEDVTERKQIELERAAHTEELERLNELMVGREMKMVKLKQELAARK